VEFAVLGPLSLISGGTRVVLPARQRTLLAMLLLRANWIVPASTLIRALWEDAPPAGARNTLHGHVRRLRQMTGAAASSRIVTREPGYLITVAAGELDLDRFSSLYSAARSASAHGDWAVALQQFDEALALWRGEALADVTSQAIQDADVPRLRELRLQAVEARTDVALRLGRHTELVAELRHLATTEPLRERLHAQLMLALYRCGQQAEALAVYRGIDRLLRDELGIEPGPALRQLHQRILLSDPELSCEDVLDGQRPVVLGVAAGPARPPAQLPADTADFTGRCAQLELLHRSLAAEPDAAMPGVPAIAAIAGMGGIGKTTLAVHAAHGLRDRFPDGQLFADLSGEGLSGAGLSGAGLSGAGLSGAGLSGADPGDVLARFLRDLGVPDDAIPGDLAARGARYRSELAGRRILVVIDDARDEKQVRPLLPASSTCGVIITSRRPLVCLPGASVLHLPAMDRTEAHAMFSAIIGARRAEAEPAATSNVLQVCAGLPLAIRIAACRLLARPGWSIAHLAGLLADRRERLATLTAGNLSLRSSFAVSYASLPADAARVFRLLGISALTTLRQPAITALAGSPVTTALEALADVSLVEVVTGGQYRVHDLLHGYAAELARRHDSTAELRAALGRLLDWYSHQAPVRVRDDMASALITG
jgi:DNA-binding SARP family transcriptional activator